jgi:hypothetical protein
MSCFSKFKLFPQGGLKLQSSTKSLPMALTHFGASDTWTQAAAVATGEIVET